MSEREEQVAHAIRYAVGPISAADIGREATAAIQAKAALAAADAVMFNDENEAWVAQIIASYGVDAPFACAAEIFAALKGAGNE